MTKVIGITGIIGTGKSLAAKYIFEKYKYKLINADEIGHSLLEKGSPVYNDIIAEYGTNNRKKIAIQVFKNKEKLEKLNNLLHPIIFLRIKELLEQYTLNNDNVLIEAALLFKIGLDRFCQKIICMTSDSEYIYERLLQRGLSKKQINERIANAPDYSEENLIIIKNNGTLENIYQQIDKQILAN